MDMLTSQVSPSHGATSGSATRNLAEVDEVAGVDEVREVAGVDEEFLALVCSDPELLRAEFESIVAAGWSSPPPQTPAGGSGDENPAVLHRPDPTPAGGRHRGGVVTLVRDGGDRTRSPPKRLRP